MTERQTLYRSSRRTSLGDRRRMEFSTGSSSSGLENLPKINHYTLARHILNHHNEKCPYAYPKVIMKTISSILISCYNAKKWIEYCKKK
jgi:hypothetical protein